MRLTKRLKNIVRRFFRECCGPTATEYAVLLVLIIFGALTAISLLGSFVSSSVESTANALPSGASGESGQGSAGGGAKSKPKKSRRGPSKRRRSGLSDFSGPQYAFTWPGDAHRSAEKA